jgi:hypothetical protein
MTNTSLKKIAYFLLFFFFSFSSYGQKMNIQGNVMDTTGKIPMHNAVVTLVRIKDSVLLGYTYTNQEGYFKINHLEIDTFSLRISYPKCDESVYFIFADSSNYEFNLQRVVLKPESNEIDEVVIYANKSPIYYRGDTLVYVADSFKVAQNAVVEDLLKKLPGIQVETDGEIRVQGRVVDKVLVDGDEFFGSDASVATKNLDAKGVETVEVYEEEDKASLESNDKIQVMNLKMKEEAKKGYFGNLSTASDFQNYYQGECLARKFNNDLKVSVYALASNTPRTGFNWQEEDEYGIDLRNVTYDEDGNKSWTTYNIEGIPQNLKSGFYFSDRYGSRKQTKLRMNYGYSDSRVNSYNRSSSQYFISDSSYFVNKLENNSNRGTLNKLGFFVESKLDSLTKLTIEPSLSITNSKKSSTNQSDFFNEGLELNRENNIVSSSDGDNLNFLNTLILERSFKKNNRSFKLNSVSNYQTGNSLGILKSTNVFTDPSVLNEAVDQEKKDKNTNSTQNIKVEFNEPISEKTTFSSSYYFGYNKVEYDRLSFNQNSNLAYDLLDTVFSMSTVTSRLQHKIGVSLFHSFKKIKFRYGVQGRTIDADNINSLLSTNFTQSYLSLFPEANIQFKPVMSKSFRLNYSTNSDLPGVNQLQSARDNSNPNNIVIGNPDLKPSYLHNFRGQMNVFNGMSGRYVYVSAFGTYFQRSFADSITNNLDQLGQIESKTVNVQGNFNTGVYIGSSMKIVKDFFKISPFLNYNFSKIKSYINGDLNNNLNNSFGIKNAFNFSFDSLSMSFSAGLDCTIPSSSLGIGLNKPFYTSTYSSNIQYQMKHGFRIESNAELTMNAKRSDGYNLNYLIWNISFSKNFLKDESLILSVIGNDIFNQNTVARRVVMQNVIIDNQTQIISRYFLLKLTYKFKNKLEINEEDESF